MNPPSTLFLFLFFVWISIMQAKANNKCPAGWVEATHGCFIYIISLETRDGARKLCREKGKSAQLAFFTNFAEYDDFAGRMFVKRMTIFLSMELDPNGKIYIIDETGTRCAPPHVQNLRNDLLLPSSIIQCINLNRYPTGVRTNLATDCYNKRSLHLCRIPMDGLRFTGVSTCDKYTQKSISKTTKGIMTTTTVNTFQSNNNLLSNSTSISNETDINARNILSITDKDETKTDTSLIIVFVAVGLFLVCVMFGMIFVVRKRRTSPVVSQSWRPPRPSIDTSTATTNTMSTAITHTTTASRTPDTTRRWSSGAKTQSPFRKQNTKRRKTIASEQPMCLQALNHNYEMVAPGKPTIMPRIKGKVVTVRAPNIFSTVEFDHEVWKLSVPHFFYYEKIIQK